MIVFENYISLGFLNVFTLLLDFLFLPKMVIDGEGRPSNGIEPETSLEIGFMHI